MKFNNYFLTVGKANMALPYNIALSGKKELVNLKQQIMYPELVFVSKSALFKASP